MLPSDFFRRNVLLSFQEGHRTASRRFPIAEGPGGAPGEVPDDEQAKPAPDRDPGMIAGGNATSGYNF